VGTVERIPHGSIPAPPWFDRLTTSGNLEIYANYQ
jgi:hypothetical protein